MSMIRTYLEKLGLNTWVDERRLNTGDEWWQVIKNSIEQACCVIVLLSPTANTSEWVQKEIDHALTCGRQVYPLLIRGNAQAESTIPPALANLQWTDIRAEFTRMDAVVRTIRERHGTACGEVKLSTPPVLNEIKATVVAVMGVRGGVGKGTFVACAAQLLAEKGDEVVIVDFDLESSGATNKAMTRPGTVRPPVKTIYDHFAPYALRFENHRGPESEQLWNITPTYLQERGLGNIWLVPAADTARVRASFEVIANIPVPREKTVLNVTYEVLNRIQRVRPQAKWILMDCGAGTNPIYSAAFVAARYRYMVILPDSSFFNQIATIKAEHVTRYPEESGVAQVNIVVNRISSDEHKYQTAVLKPIGFIPEDPTLQADDFQQPIDFDLGYSAVLEAIHRALNASFDMEDRKRLPKEENVRLLPWLNPVLRNRLASRLLNDKLFKRTTLLLYGVTIGSAVVTVLVVAAALILKLLQSLQPLATSEISAVSTPVQTAPQIDLVLVLTGIAATLAGAYFLREQLRKRALLRRVVVMENTESEIEQYALLRKLIHGEMDMSRGTLHWFNQQVQKAQQADKSARSHQVAKYEAKLTFQDQNSDIPSAIQLSSESWRSLDHFSTQGSIDDDDET
ncbi:MAG: TIR domain-containing protein [Anaerolineae bacterium]|nr:TIR domain-containing protein [Anaerolineae bacterium]